MAIVLPISSPILPGDYDRLPEGYTRESLIQNYGAYASNVRDALERQAPDSFLPTIDMLDDLVKGLTAAP